MECDHPPTAQELVRWGRLEALFCHVCRELLGLSLVGATGSRRQEGPEGTCRNGVRLPTPPPAEVALDPGVDGDCNRVRSMKLSLGPLSVSASLASLPEPALHLAVELKVPLIGFRMDMSLYGHLNPRVAFHGCLMPWRACVEADAVFVGAELEVSKS